MDPNLLPTPAERKRAAVFFGPSTSRTAELMLAWEERLLNRIREPSIYILHTNAGRQEYRLVVTRNRNVPVVLHFQRGGEQSILRVYNWTQREAAYLSEPPLMTSVCAPSHHWEELAQKLDRTGFWQKPSWLEPWAVKDGDLMVLEVLDRGRYHVVGRASTEDEEIEALCQSLMNSAPRLPSQ